MDGAEGASKTKKRKTAAVVASDASKVNPPVAANAMELDPPLPDGTVHAVDRKERVLVLCTRGTAARYRHLMLDLIQLLPHSKKESKLDVKRDFKIVADIAEIKSCTSAVLFETRKFKDLYIWMSKTAGGPSIKFAAQNSTVN